MHEVSTLQNYVPACYVSTNLPTSVIYQNQNVCLPHIYFLLPSWQTLQFPKRHAKPSVHGCQAFECGMRSTLQSGQAVMSLLSISRQPLPRGEPIHLAHKRHPVTLEHLFALREGLQTSNSFDVAIWAVALCTFWGCCHLGELTISSCNAFNERLHVAKSVPISFCRHFGGAESAQFHIPWAKMERQEGTDLIFTSREDLCPVEALHAHLKANMDVPANAHSSHSRPQIHLGRP